MKEETTQGVTQFDRAEALDRIHVIQTMLCELLGFDGDMCTHKGLSHDAEWLVSEAMEKLCEAYQAQGLYVFDEGEAMNDKLTQQVWRFMKGGDDAAS